MPATIELPRLAAIVGAVDVGLAVVEAMPVDRRRRRVSCVEVRRFDDADLRPRRERRRRDVVPVRAFIARAPDEAVVGADPEQIRVERRWRDRVDHAAARALSEIVGGSHRVEVRRHVRRFAREVRADRAPVLAAVDRCGTVAGWRNKVACGSRLEKTQRQRPCAPVEIVRRRRASDRSLAIWPVRRSSLSTRPP